MTASVLLLLASVAFGGDWITDAEMAAAEPRNVKARQLEVGKLEPVNEHLRNRHVLFRKSFTLGPVTNAAVRVTADDYYKLYVNGTFVGQGPCPGFPEHTFYDTIDVAPYLKDGTNVLAVHTYYQGLVNRVWVSGDNRHGLLLDLVADGKRVVKSDTSFRTARHGAYSAMGVVGYDTQFMERYDAGAAEVGFERPDFDDSAWRPATVNPHGGDYAVFPRPIGMTVLEEVKPKKLEVLDGGGLRVDFGSVWVGSLRLDAKGEKGLCVALKCGQELNPDGTVRHRLRANCEYAEEMVLSGGERDTLNQYDYKSFRYAEIWADPGAEVDTNSVVLVARHQPFVLAAKPSFTDPRLEPVWRMCVDSFHYGVQEQMMDCMDREKGYYLGDGVYTIYAYCRLTGKWAYARKFIDDFLRTADIDRGLMTCGNCSFMQEIAEYPLMLVWFAERYLDETGDARFIRDRFDAFVDVLDRYHDRYERVDGLISGLDKWCVVEWPPNYRDGYDADLREGKVCGDMHNAINAWYVGAIRTMNSVARRVGRPEYVDEDRYLRAFQKTFYDRRRHLFVDREGSGHVSLPGNVYAAFFRLEPASDAVAFKREFLSLVRERNFKSINLFQFVPLFTYLRETGETKLLGDLLASPDAWLRAIGEGFDRSIEGWSRDAKWNTSLFHLTTASVALFLCEPARSRE